MTKQKKATKVVKEEKTEWQKKVEADLNAIAKLVYNQKDLEINKETK